MCSTPEFTKKFQYIRLNILMKEHLSSTFSDADPMFYRQNTFNKTLTLPFYRKKFGKKIGCYPNRTEKCFPAKAPISCPPMVHRTVYSTRPKATNDVILPSRETLQKTYTLKIDKKFLKKMD